MNTITIEKEQVTKVKVEIPIPFSGRFANGSVYIDLFVNEEYDFIEISSGGGLNPGRDFNQGKLDAIVHWYGTEWIPIPKENILAERDRLCAMAKDIK